MSKDHLAGARRLLNGNERFADADEAREYLEMEEWADSAVRQEQWAAEEERRDLASSETRARAHLNRADEISDIRDKFERTARSYSSQAAGVVRGAAGGRLPSEEFRTFTQSTDRFVFDSNRARQLAKLEARERREAAKIIHEPGPYEEGSPHSWIRDALAVSEPEAFGVGALRGGVSDMSSAAVQERFDRHARDVRSAVVKRSKYGKRVERIVSEQYRQEDAEIPRSKAREDIHRRRYVEGRALTTGGGATSSVGTSGSAFVPPAIIIDGIWAPFRSPYRAFVDQLNTSQALPDYGMQAYVPAVSGGTSVTTQTEGAAVSETDPVTTYASCPIVMKAGQVTVTQQFLDRAGPGISGDQMLFAQLRQQMDAQIDAYAISQAISGATAITNTGSFAVSAASGVGGLLKDLKTAKNATHDAAGVRLRSTHAFAIGDFVDYLGSYSDAQGRPLFTPDLDDNRLPIRSQGDTAGEGYSGYVLVGLGLFADDNIPNSSSNAQIIVCRPDTILQLEGAPIPYLYPPTFAGSLEGVLGLRNYVATIARFPSGVAVISGAAYLATQFA